MDETFSYSYSDRGLRSGPHLVLGPSEILADSIVRQLDVGEKFTTISIGILGLEAQDGPAPDSLSDFGGHDKFTGVGWALSH